MKVLKSVKNNTAKIINKKSLSREKKYRLSLYAYPYAENGRYLLHNIMTGEVVELDSKEWSAAEMCSKVPQEYSFIADIPALTELAQKRYIVETDYDEVTKYQQAAFLLKTAFGTKKGYKMYNIFPTTGCNARCVYCFEENFTPQVMTIETADRIIDFISETRREGMIQLRWFGGEPLLGKHIIRHICTQLQKREIPYRSAMVTNASLMTRELAREARELWNLKKIQVSLDGAKEDYTSRKNYYDPEKYNYDSVMQSIGFLLDEGIGVILRVNFDRENFSRLRGFLDELKERFGSCEELSIYLYMLFQQQKEADSPELFRKMFELLEYMHEIGLKGRSTIGEMRTNYCMADALDDCVLIEPDGTFNNCDFLPGSHRYGNIFDGVTNEELLTSLKKQAQADEQCRKCPFLPECTPFYKKNCPVWFGGCYEYKRMAADHALHNLLRGKDTETEDDEDQEPVRMG